MRALEQAQLLDADLNSTPRLIACRPVLLAITGAADAVGGKAEGDQALQDVLHFALSESEIQLAATLVGGIGLQADPFAGIGLCLGGKLLQRRTVGGRNAVGAGAGGEDDHRIGCGRVGGCRTGRQQQTEDGTGKLMQSTRHQCLAG